MIIQSSVSDKSYPVLSIYENDKLYCFWWTNNHICYKKCVEGVWDYSPTYWIEEEFPEGAYPSLSSFYKDYEGYVGLCYVSEYRYKGYAWWHIHFVFFNIEAEPSNPPKLTLFEPVINNGKVTINGVTLPRMPNSSIVKLHWDWGDGYSEDCWFPVSHIYENSGTYNITVTSYQSDGSSTMKAIVIPEWLLFKRTEVT